MSVCSQKETHLFPDFELIEISNLLHYWQVGVVGIESAARGVYGVIIAL
jgi:hypothetical protein